MKRLVTASYIHHIINFVLTPNWCDTFPVCLFTAIDCGHPGDIENGNVTYSSTFAGSFATYSCNDGYQLDPPYGTIRFCTQLGNWSGDIPTCVGE